MFFVVMMFLALLPRAATGAELSKCNVVSGSGPDAVEATDSVTAEDGEGPDSTRRDGPKSVKDLKLSLKSCATTTGEMYTFQYNWTLPDNTTNVESYSPGFIFPLVTPVFDSVDHPATSATLTLDYQVIEDLKTLGIIPSGTEIFDYKATVKTNVSSGNPKEGDSTSINKLPEEPAGLSAIPGTDEVELTWDPLSDPDALPVTTFKLYRGATEVADISAGETTYTETGLLPDTDYTYRLKAQGPCISGSPGDTATATISTKTLAANTQPAAPTGVMVAPHADSGQHYLVVTWGAVTDAGTGSSIDNYQVKWQKADGTGSTRSLDVGTSTTFDMKVHNERLNPGETWDFWVRARNNIDVWSETSDTVEGTTQTTPPSVPENVTATLEGAFDVLIEWDEPADSGSSEITLYQIERTPMSSGTPEIAGISTTTSYEDKGLDDDEEYSYRIRAQNATDWGPWSTPPAVVEVPLVPQPTPPTMLDARAISATGIKVRWDIPPGMDTTEVRRGQGINQYTLKTTRSALNFASLSANTTYEITARSINAHGMSTWTAPISVTTSSATGDAPGDVQNLAGQVSDLTDPTKLLLEVSWDPPADSGSSAIEAYAVEYSSSANDVSVFVDHTGSSTHSHELEVENVEDTYSVFVGALNGSGIGDFDWVTINVSGSPTPPREPRSLMAAFTANKDSIEISWEKPRNQGSSPITGYTVDVNNESFPLGLVTSYEYEITDPAETLFEIAVVAHNSDGTSDPAEIELSIAGPTFSIADLTVGEDVGTATLTVTLAAGEGAASVAWRTKDGSATGSAKGGDGDFEAGNGTLAFGSSDTSMDIDIVILDDTVSESAETFEIELSSPSGATIADGIGVVTIRANDGGEISATLRPPMNLSASPRDSNTIRLSWEHPDSGDTPDRFEIQAKLGSSAWVTIEDQADGTVFQHRGLSAGQTWMYRMRSWLGSENSTWTEVVTASTEAGTPSAPRDLAAAGRSPTSIDLTWRRPASDGGSPITGYRIQTAPPGEPWEDLEANTGNDATSYVHTGVPASSIHRYRVAAINSKGQGPWSDVARAETDADRPSAPIGLQAEPDGPGAILLGWLPPVSDGGAEITGYRIRAQAPGESTWESLEQNTGNTGTSYRHTGLSPGEEWVYQVAAINGAGPGEWSNTAKARTERTRPGKPRDLTAIAHGSNRIDLSWRAPASDGGSAIWSYIIEYLGDDGTWKALVANTGSTQTSHTHRDLEPGAEWTYRVIAVNDVGRGEPSEQASARTDAIPPDPPSSLEAAANGPHAIRIRWGPPLYTGGSEILSYRIEASQDDEMWMDLTETTAAIFEYEHGGLDPAATWNYRVYATNEAGTSPASAPVTATTDPIRPDPPTRVTATAEGISEILVTWVPPDYNGGAEITSYRIETSEDGLTWTGETFEVADRAFRHTGLEPATTWFYRVSSINRAGTSDPSEIASATTDATVPDAPTDLRAKALDHETVDVRWKAPEYDGGAEVYAYMIQFSLNGDDWEELEELSVDTEALHEGLTPATVYHYRAAAVNEIGRSDWTDPVMVETPARVPDPPRDLTAEAADPNTIELEWSPPEYDGGASVSAYEIEYSPDGSDWKTLTDPVDDLGYSDTSVEPGATRYYRVFAMNRAGRSEASEVASATTDDPVGRANRVNAAILPAFMAVVSEDIVQAISTRAETVSRDGAMNGIQGARLREVENLAQLASGVEGSYRVLKGGELGVWFRSSHTSMSDKGEVDWSGGVLSTHSGLDVQLPENLVAGLAVSRSSGGFDFTDHADARSVDGTLDTWTVSLTPYLAWNPTSKLSVWAAGSKSLGETQLEDGLAGVREADTRSTLVAGGVNGWLMSGGASEWSVRAEGWQNWVTGEAGTGLDELTFTLRRFRAMLDWSLVNRFVGNHELHVVASGGMRHDLHDGAENASGVEVGGGLRYLSPENRLKIEGTGRVLLTTDSDYEEWGIGGMIQLDPSGGRGLAMQVEPSYGSTASQTARLYENGVLRGASVFGPKLMASMEYRGLSMSAPYGRLMLGRENRFAIGSTIPWWQSVSVEGVASGRGLALGVKGGFKY